MSIPKCVRCDRPSDFGYRKDANDEWQDYCHGCFAIDHPGENEEYDPVEVKNMAMALAAKRAAQ